MSDPQTTTQQYPKWLFHPDGRSKTVETVQKHQQAADEGFMTADEFDSRAALPQVAPATDAPAPSASTEAEKTFVPTEFGGTYDEKA